MFTAICPETFVHGKLNKNSCNMQTSATALEEFMHVLKVSMLVKKVESY